MPRDLNEAQRAVLHWIAEGHPPGSATNPQRLSARALVTRRLVTIRGRGPAWRAELTDLGRYVVKHGSYPEPPPPPPGTDVADVAAPPGAVAIEASLEGPPQLEVDSPRGMRRRGHRPRGDGLFAPHEEDPYDEKILITVKEAAWMMSVSTTEVHRAARDGEIDIVSIGSTGTRYRLVYGSFLAWLNDLPRHSAASSWWR